MAKYIDTEQIKWERHERVGLGIDYSTDDPGHYYVAYKSQVDNIPVADVREVIHGKWIEKEHWVPLAWDSSPFSYDPDEYDEDTHSEKRVYWHCDKCDYEMSRNIKPNKKYCPNCGAKMDDE